MLRGTLFFLRQPTVLASATNSAAKSAPSKSATRKKHKAAYQALGTAQLEKWLAEDKEFLVAKKKNKLGGTMICDPADGMVLLRRPRPRASVKKERNPDAVRLQEAIPIEEESKTAEKKSSEAQPANAKAHKESVTSEKAAK